MKNTPPPMLLLLGLLALPTTVLAAADRQAGIAAYEHVDYATAIEILTPLAEAGDGEAARYLGMMHDPSLHGSLELTYMSEYQNVIEALRWYAIGAGSNSAMSLCLMRALFAISDLRSVKDDLVEVELKNFVHWTDADQRQKEMEIAVSEQALENATGEGHGEAAFFRMRGCGESDHVRGQQGRIDAAIETLEPLARDGSASDALYLGHTHWFNTDNVSAYAWYEVALALDNRHAEFYRFLIIQALREKEYAPAEAKAAALLKELNLEFAPMESDDPITIEKRTDKDSNFNATPIRLTCRERPKLGSHMMYTECVKLWSVH